MNKDLDVKNIVLVGVFNPSLFDKYFFIKNEIIKEEDILPNSFTLNVGISQLICEKFNLQVGLNQIIISSNNPSSSEDEIDKIAIKILKAQPIEINALGLNFHWFVRDNSKTLEQFSRECYYSDSISLFNKFFDNDNARFGVYASTDIYDSRLKLDVKPIIRQKIDNESRKLIEEELLQFTFNFHFDRKSKNEVFNPEKYISNFESYKNECQKILSIY